MSPSSMSLWELPVRCSMCTRTSPSASPPLPTMLAAVAGLLSWSLSTRLTVTPSLDVE